MGVIAIVIGFTGWFFLSKLNFPKVICVRMSLIMISSHRHSGLHGGYQCHAALSSFGLGRVLLQVRRVRGLAVRAVLLRHIVRGVGGAEGISGLIMRTMPLLFGATHNYVLLYSYLPSA